MLIAAIIILIAIGTAAWQNAYVADFFHVSYSQSLLILVCAAMILIIYLLHIFYMPSALKSTRENQINCGVIGAVGLVGPHIFLNISKLSINGYGELTATEPSAVGFICAFAAFAMGILYQREYNRLCEPSNISWSSEGHTMRALGITNRNRR